MTSRSNQETSSSQKSKSSKVTVYDAVAGRAGYEGFLTSLPPSKHRDTTSSSTKAVPAEEVLFRRKGAPVRYEEDDIYFADRQLGPEQRLPDSDLLKILHAYAADFYGTLSGDDGTDFRSLDETALLAMGILIEEAAKEALGTTGELGLVEPVDGHSGPANAESSDDLDSG